MLLAEWKLLYENKHLVCYQHNPYSLLRPIFYCFSTSPITFFKNRHDPQLPLKKPNLSVHTTAMFVFHTRLRYLFKLIQNVRWRLLAVHWYVRTFKLGLKQALIVIHCFLTQPALLKIPSFQSGWQNLHGLIRVKMFEFMRLKICINVIHSS